MNEEITKKKVGYQKILIPILAVAALMLVFRLLFPIKPITQMPGAGTYQDYIFQMLATPGMNQNLSQTAVNGLREKLGTDLTEIQYKSIESGMAICLRNELSDFANKDSKALQPAQVQGVKDLIFGITQKCLNSGNYPIHKAEPNSVSTTAAPVSKTYRAYILEVLAQKDILDGVAIQTIKEVKLRLGTQLTNSQYENMRLGIRKCIERDMKLFVASNDPKLVDPVTAKDVSGLKQFFVDK